MIFNRGLDLPGFASFPLLEQADTRLVLAQQMEALVALADEAKLGCILDTPTWMANVDRAAPLGYDADRLDHVNRDAAAVMEQVRQAAKRDDVLLSACIGPRQDPYVQDAAMTVEDARSYHARQLSVFQDTPVDFATGYTFNRVDEAAKCVLAAKEAGLRIVMSFVVETDGCLADGTTLLEAIGHVDAKSEQFADYFMVNCAHPSHFANALVAHPRLQGVVANASVCSHAELDEAESLDAGDPVQLGKELAEIRRANPDLRVFGGCCGTDMRHMACIADALSSV
ncbi:homocysteine S-methyltransferase family protein [Dinoroseobacter sp. PD6]|uniref:homocysteine S-methyltransferase family protein n=1 Tax=Dinoroseobacter sp. PD6 TaxID=3028384 RepID=UPI00237C2087|nr:homocysteine S-methyltransferase family protein [Dinoroseobacter sp. PD6]MDD9718823.1 homocysteine S-methyltransferase family protein [Dinoroseobacter sp. PD6]